MQARLRIIRVHLAETRYNADRLCWNGIEGGGQGSQDEKSDDGSDNDLRVHTLHWKSLALTTEERDYKGNSGLSPGRLERRYGNQVMKGCHAAEGLLPNHTILLSRP